MIGTRGIVDYMIGSVVFSVYDDLIIWFHHIVHFLDEENTFSLHVDRTRLLFPGVYMFYRSFEINVYCHTIHHGFLFYHRDDDLAHVERAISSVK